MLKPFIGAAAILAMVSTGVLARENEPPCAPYGYLAETLKEQYEEEPVAIGILANGNLLTIFFCDEGEKCKSGTSSFTMLSTDVRGRSCIVAAGHSFMAQWPIPGQGA